MVGAYYCFANTSFVCTSCFVLLCGRFICCHGANEREYAEHDMRTFALLRTVYS